MSKKTIGPYLIPIIIVIITTLWLLSGAFSENSTNEETPTNESNSEAKLPTVQYIHSIAQAVDKKIHISGKTAPSRKTTITAETSGQVIELGIARGKPIKKGELILRIDARARNEEVEKAKALLAQRQLEFESANKLAQTGYNSKVLQVTAKANLESAKAALKQARLDLARTEIVAPFDGILSERYLEIGDFVDIGNPIATVIDMNPFIISGELSEQDRANFNIGQNGITELITGEILNGTIRYISPEADPATRTFTTELEIQNPEYNVASGTTAEMIIPYANILAHKLSPALLSLNNEGVIGIKSFDEQQQVVFMPIEIIRSDETGIWLTGLDNEINIISIGHGFVSPGEKVQAIEQIINQSKS